MFFKKYLQGELSFVGPPSWHRGTLFKWLRAGASASSHRYRVDFEPRQPTELEGIWP